MRRTLFLDRFETFSSIWWILSAFYLIIANFIFAGISNDIGGAMMIFGLIFLFIWDF